ncbi:hypothetical protein P3064_003213 [Escherichia coli]|uniref:hypothetical protein n=1 Tax=Escherichia coli TaxID=562 RepID=UPI001795563A|nr:hypothetical protein [Escherichia coli]EFH3744911.1 hypothetical protein [Escherichia coli]EHD5842916.1 hypothetical protein [Escherichia coli]EID6773275.1 hypothetical protein [Escherichia coli]EKO0565999.1 hypothetical protein [Escherichia coli]EKP8508226.1 hypothetical protein [Escherichia coli]
MKTEKRKVTFVVNNKDLDSLMMDVLVEPQCNEKNEEIYGYANQENASKYVDSRYAIEWDSKKERFVVHIPKRIRIN